jgi:hypothetical protein
MTTPIVIRRQQYTFVACPRCVALLLTELGAEKVNVAAIVIVRTTRVTLVVGPGGADAPRQNARLEKALRRAHIGYQRNEVLQLLNLQAASSTPGAYARFYGALEKAHIEVGESYFGESVAGQAISAFFRVPRGRESKAQKVLEAA